MERIAVIGMGCLFPEAHDPEQFFNLLMDRRDVTTPLSAQELGCDPSVYFHPRPGTPDKIGYHKNGHIRNFQPDLRGYGVDPSDLQDLDRIYQWTIHAAGQALEDSGYRHDGAKLKSCGIILGSLMFPTLSSKRIFPESITWHWNRIYKRSCTAPTLPWQNPRPTGWLVSTPGRRA